MNIVWRGLSAVMVVLALLVIAYALVDIAAYLVDPVMDVLVEIPGTPYGRNDAECERKFPGKEYIPVNLLCVPLSETGIAPERWDEILNNPERFSTAPAP